VALGDPYGIQPTSAELIPIIAASAVSNYVPRLFPTFPVPASAADLDTVCQAWWAQNVATGFKVVPNALLGFDKRPMIELPPVNTTPTPWLGDSVYFARGTNAQIATHLQNCVNFIGANQPACDSKLMLVYAWNELSEGGTGGIPTIGDPPTGSPPTTALLSAIKPVLTAAA
jgi:hypothetical protein